MVLLVQRQIMELISTTMGVFEYESVLVPVWHICLQGPVSFSVIGQSVMTGPENAKVGKSIMRAV